MYDAALMYRELAERRGSQLSAKWTRGAFALATVHRAENTDDPARLRAIVSALDRIAQTVCPVVWPVHPRTRKYLADSDVSTGAIATAEPFSYLDMLLLEGRARFILTDSGGVQKEAYFFQVPCITLRDETEWQETLENRCNVLAGSDPEAIVAAATAVQAGPWVARYGTGCAGTEIVDALERAGE
jgi:UDP-GlcNAc3NAcA epimerase